MSRDGSSGRVDRRSLLKTTGVAAAVGLAGCGGDGGDTGGDGGDTGGDGGDTGGDGGDTGGDGGTPTEMGPPSEVEPYLDAIPDYYPDDYWRIIDGAMEDGQIRVYTSYFGSFAEDMLANFTDTFDFFETNLTTLGTAEVFSRFTTEASRGQINPDALFTYDPIAIRQLHTAGLMQGYVSPEEEHYADRSLSSIDGMLQGGGHSVYNHGWNPSLFEEAGIEVPKRLPAVTDSIEDNPDFWSSNTCLYDGITSTSGWQQIDYYEVVHGLDWVQNNYEVLATTDPRSFWSTSTMGGWVANGEVAWGLGLATWILDGFVLPDFSKEQVAWGQYFTTNVQMPNYNVVKDSTNPDAAKLLKDWMMSESGQLFLANNWSIVPSRLGMNVDDLPEIPYWDVPPKIETILDEGEYLDSIFMDFEDRTTRSSQKSKYKDMWYNIMT